MEEGNPSVKVLNDLRDALEADELKTIAQLLLLSIEMSIDSSCIQTFRDLETRAKDRLAAWRTALTAGSYADYKCVSHRNKWFLTKILWRAVDEYRVHYIGWPDKFDETIPVSPSEMHPPNTFTTTRIPGTSKRKRIEVSMPASAPEGASAEESPAPVVSEEVPPVQLSRSGRVIKTKTKKAPAEAAPRKSQRVAAQRDNNEALCPVCGELEDDDPYSTHSAVLCDGPCMRAFHTSCIGLSELPAGDWLCEDCSAGRHQCFVCDVVGKDIFEVRNCSMPNCGKHYHYDCLLGCRLHSVEGRPPPAKNLMSYKSSQRAATEESTKETSREPRHEEETLGFRFKCPLHFCDVCYDFYGSHKSDGKRGELVPCVYCPTAFHLHCIPPDARYNQYYLVCGRHPERALPSYDPPVAGAGEFAQVWDQMLPFELRPDPNKTFENHFYLPRHIARDVECVVPPFQKICQLDYSSFPGGVSSVPLHSSDETCDCLDDCGADCYNRQLAVECNPKGRGPVNCNLGGDCSNNGMQIRDYVRTERFREEGRGTGLRTLEDIPAGRLVIEYIGEVIDEEEMQRRMEHQRVHAPHDHEYYIMQLEPRVFVDGKHKGNESRFINHACNPNCELVPWTVRGRKRIGIFSMGPISAGTALSYDYQFDTLEANEFKCLCGAPQCRGTMAPKKKARDSKDMSKAERQRLMLRGKAKLQMTETQLVEQEWALSLTARTLPGDAKHEVRNGPVGLKAVKSLGLLLTRNTKGNTRFEVRRKRLEAKALREREGLPPVAADTARSSKELGAFLKCRLADMALIDSTKGLV